METSRAFISLHFSCFYVDEVVMITFVKLLACGCRCWHIQSQAHGNNAVSFEVITLFMYRSVCKCFFGRSFFAYCNVSIHSLDYTFFIHHVFWQMFVDQRINGIESVNCNRSRLLYFALLFVVDRLH